MRIISLILFVFLGFAIVHGEFKSPYDNMFSKLDESSTNIIFEALDSLDLNLVYSALKRVGELRLKSAAPRVREWLGASTPASNVGKAAQRSKLRNIFHVSLWALGRVGNNDDAVTLSTYWRDLKDKESQYYLIKALGEMQGSKIAIEKLNELTKSIKDQRLAYALLVAIEKQNSKSSILPLVVLEKKSSFSPEFKKRVNELIAKLNRSGK